MKNLNVTINFDLDNEKWIWFDCDGTWIDLYGVEGWLDMLINKDTTPYAIAKPLVNLTWFSIIQSSFCQCSYAQIQQLCTSLFRAVDKGVAIVVQHQLLQLGSNELEQCFLRQGFCCKKHAGAAAAA